MKLDTIIITVIVALLSVRANTWFSEPTMHLRYEPVYPLYQSAADRPYYNNSMFSTEVSTNGVLQKAVLKLVTIIKEGRTLNGASHPVFGLSGVIRDPFEPHTIAETEHIGLASVQTAPWGQKALNLFTSNCYPAAGEKEKITNPGVEFLCGMPFGEFDVTMALYADNVSTPKRVTFHLSWQNGNPEPVASIRAFKD